MKNSLIIILTIFIHTLNAEELSYDNCINELQKNAEAFFIYVGSKNSRYYKEVLSKIDLGKNNLCVINKNDKVIYPLTGKTVDAIYLIDLLNLSPGSLGYFSKDGVYEKELTFHNVYLGYDKNILKGILEYVNKNLYMQFSYEEHIFVTYGNKSVERYSNLKNAKLINHWYKIDEFNKIIKHNNGSEVPLSNYKDKIIVCSPKWTVITGAMIYEIRFYFPDKDIYIETNDKISQQFINKYKIKGVLKVRDYPKRYPVTYNVGNKVISEIIGFSPGYELVRLWGLPLPEKFTDKNFDISLGEFYE